MRTLAVTSGLVVVVLTLLFTTCLFGCGGKVDKSFQPQARVEKWDNSEWASVLAAVATPDGLVRHDLLKNNTNGVRDRLFRYVGMINVAGPENRPDLFPTEKDKLAYYINAYNAVCMYLVVKRDFPKDHSKGIPPYGLYFVDKVPVGGKNMNLDFMEKTYLRPVDPRIHFAINCMSASCPPLRNEPYESARLDAQLDEQGRRFLSDRRGAYRDGDKVVISEIFKFFTNDFVQPFANRSGRKDASVLDAIQQYAADDSPIRGAASFAFQDYDWSLNKAADGR